MKLSSFSSLVLLSTATCKPASADDRTICDLVNGCHKLSHRRLGSPEKGKAMETKNKRRWGILNPTARQMGWNKEVESVGESKLEVGSQVYVRYPEGESLREQCLRLGTAYPCRIIRDYEDWKGDTKYEVEYKDENGKKYLGPKQNVFSRSDLAFKIPNSERPKYFVTMLKEFKDWRFSSGVSCLIAALLCQIWNRGATASYHDMKRVLVDPELNAAYGPNEAEAFRAHALNLNILSITLFLFLIVFGLTWACKNNRDRNLVWTFTACVSTIYLGVNIGGMTAEYLPESSIESWQGMLIGFGASIAVVIAIMFITHWNVLCKGEYFSCAGGANGIRPR